MEFLFGEIQEWFGDAITEDTIDLELLAGGKSEYNEVVVLKALAYLKNIQTILDQPTNNPDGLIAISLQDMKIVNTLVKIVVFCGIAPNLSFVLPAKWNIPATHKPDFLVAILDKLHELLSVKDDLSDTILLTQFQVYVMAGAVETVSQERFVSFFTTYQLYQTYMMLLSTPTSPEVFKAAVSSLLSKLPLEREDSVRAMIELFTGYRSEETLQVERLESLVSIFSHPPSGVKIQTYLEVMHRQLFAIISSTQTPTDIVTAACYLIDLLDERARATLKALRDLILIPLKTAGDKNFEKSLMALTNLSERRKATKMVLHITEHQIATIWLVFVHLCETNAPNGSVLKLLVALIGLNHDFLHALMEKVLITRTSDGLMPVVNNNNTLQGPQVSLVEFVQKGYDNMDMEVVEKRVDLLLTVVRKLDDKIITNLFISLLRESLKPSLEGGFNLGLIIRLTVLRELGENFRSRLFTQPKELIGMCLSVIDLASIKVEKPEILEPLSHEQDSDDEDEDDHNKVDPELVEICIDLLIGVFIENIDDSNVTEMIASQRDQIEVLRGSGDENLDVKVNHCLRLIDGFKEDRGIDLGDDKLDLNNSAEVLASATKSLNDPLVPVKAFGLQSLRTLVKRKDPIVSVERVLELSIKQLKDDDSYLYLNAIKTIEQCSFSYGPNAVIPTLIDLYADRQGDLDFTLRVGEAMVHVLQQSARAIRPEVTIKLVNVLIARIRVQEKQDTRIRMSSVSIMGWAVSENILGLHECENDIFDCCLGILKMEKDAEMLRSGLVLTLEIINHVNEGNLKLDGNEISQIKTQLKLCVSSEDEVVSSYAKDILAVM